MKKVQTQGLPGLSPFWTVGVVLLSVLVATLANVWQDYNNEVDHEFSLLEVHARQREASIVGALESVNLMLGNIMADINEKPVLSTADKNQMLKDVLRQLPQLRSLIITDATGRVAASNNEQLLGFDASQREYFSVHRDAPLNQAFHIAVPFKTVTGVFATTLSRSIVDDNNRFVGVAVATFDAGFFNKTLDFRIPTPGTQAVLAHRSGTILSAMPNTKLAGQSLAGGPAFSSHLASTQDSTRHIPVTKLEQVKRLVIVQNIGSAPLMVILTSDFDVAIAQWRRSMLIHLAAFLSLAVITLVATAQAARRQRALAERESFIKTVTDAMPGMVGYWDSDLLCQFANKTYLEWFGKPPEAIIGQSALSLFGQTLFEQNAPLMREALKGQSQHFERTLTKADGSVGYAYAHYIADVREAGEVVGFFVLVTDVTLLKQAELKLRESEAFTRSVLDSLTEHVAVLDANGVITAVNTAWQQFAVANGAADQSRVSIGTNYFEICGNAVGRPDGDEAAQVLAGIRRVIDGSLTDFTLEYPCHSPQEKRWFSLHVMPLNGDRRGAVLSHRNVTIRHQTQTLLRASEEHFRLLAENQADLVWRADAQMRFTYVNQADRRMRGFESDEVLGTTIAEALTPQGQAILAEVKQKRREAESSGQKGLALNFEIPMRCKNGSVLWIELSTVPTYDADGKIIGFQGSGRDISERKWRESQLLESQQLLESHLKEVEDEKSVLQEQTVRDPLTGIFNRRYLDDTLPRELARAAREGYPVAVVMIDLDHFKHVNDQYGHAAGDEVLRALAVLLKKGARTSDIVCRYGGEEFVAIMPNMAIDLVLQRVESWRIELQAMTFGQNKILVTLSAGIAGFPGQGDDAATLLARADEMLYRSKAEGRNRITVYGIG